MSVNRRKCLSICEKVEIIRELERGAKNVTVCKKFSLPSSTVSTLWKNKEIYLSAMERNLTKKKKFRKCGLTDVDEALLQWFTVQRNAALSINGPILKAQAEKFAKQFGHNDFICNNGWIDRFKNRHNILYAKTSGGSEWLFNNDTEEFEGADDDMMITCDLPIASDVVVTVLNNGDEHSDDRSMMSESEANILPTTSQARDALDTLDKFFQRTDSNNDVINALNVIRQNLRSEIGHLKETLNLKHN